MTLSKDEVLSKTSAYQILDYYLKPFHEFGKLTTGKNFSNPFLADKQETPSFNIYRSNEGKEYRYKDFATGDDGSCFDLVMKLFNFSFPEALNRINADMNLGIGIQPSVSSPASVASPIQHEAVSLAPQSNPISTTANYRLKKRPLNAVETSYWNQFGITPEVLQMFNVSALEEFSSISKQDKPYTMKSNSENFIFAYDHDNWAKLYKPIGDKKFRFQHLGVKDPDFIFGWDQLPTNGDMVFITGGEKDVMSLTAHGFYAISLNSETANLKSDTVSELKQRFKNVVILYDRDETGIKQSNLLSDSHSLKRVELPIIPNGGKDISDYFANNGDVQFINSLVLTASPCKNKELCFEPLDNLIDKFNVAPQIPFLWSGIKVGSFGFVFGPSKSGKTIFCENLGMSIASGLHYFMRSELNTGAKKVLFISMEEFWQQRTERNSNQATHLNISLGDYFLAVNENFPRQITTNEEWDYLKNNIIESKAEVVFIDSLTRLYNGSIEESNLSKELCFKLRELTNELKITLIVIHHCPKQNGRPLTIDSLAGSRMLAQEADFMIGISKAPDGTRYMKEVAFRYKQENEDTVQIFKINDHAWLDPINAVPESTILKAADGRHDSSNSDAVLEFFQDIDNSTDGVFLAKDLIETFVASKIMSKPTLYKHLKLLTDNKMIQSNSIGKYSLCEVNPV